jgi:hypothetical protein
MQPILAESAPHRARAIAIAAAALAVVTSLALAFHHAPSHHERHHRGHRLHQLGHCATLTYVDVGLR